MEHVRKKFAWLLVIVYVLFSFFLSYKPSQESAKISISAMELWQTLLPYWRPLLVSSLLLGIILFIIWQKQRVFPLKKQLKNFMIFIIGLFLLGTALNFILTYQLNNVAELNLNYWTQHLFIRKYGHLFLYLLMGCIVKNAFSVSQVKGSPAFLGALFICISVAFSDETLQFFVPGRTALISDIAIDTLGAFIGISIYTFLESLCGNRTIWQAFWNKSNTK